MKVMFIIFILSFGFSLDENGEIGFSYGVLGRLKSQEEKITILQDKSMIQTGDSVRINVGYKKDTHMYVIYKGSEGEFMMLYPEGSGNTENLADLPDTLYNTVLHWSQFSDPTGFETFYLINANESLNELVKLMSRYDNVNPKGRMKLGKLIEKELDALNPENMGDLASIGSRLDKPIVGGVAFRGEGDEIKDLSLTDQCVGKYGIAYKQIILNHK